MGVMNADDRRDLVGTLRVWLENAEAGVKCSDAVSPGMIGLIKRASDKPDPPGGPADVE